MALSPVPASPIILQFSVQNPQQEEPNQGNKLVDTFFLKVGSPPPITAIILSYCSDSFRNYNLLNICTNPDEKNPLNHGRGHSDIELGWQPSFLLQESMQEEGLDRDAHRLLKGKAEQMSSIIQMLLRPNGLQGPARERLFPFQLAFSLYGQPINDILQAFDGRLLMNDAPQDYLRMRFKEIGARANTTCSEHNYVQVANAVLRTSINYCHNLDHFSLVQKKNILSFLEKLLTLHSIIRNERLDNASLPDDVSPILESLWENICLPLLECGFSTDCIADILKDKVRGHEGDPSLCMGARNRLDGDSYITEEDIKRFIITCIEKTVVQTQLSAPIYHYPVAENVLSDLLSMEKLC